MAETIGLFMAAVLFVVLAVDALISSDKSAEEEDIW